MTDLNVTEGEWRVEYGNLLVVGDVRYEMLNEHNAYLIAQAKNMYEMLGELLKNEECDVFEMSSEIQELLSACKPPEE